MSAGCDFFSLVRHSIQRLINLLLTVNLHHHSLSSAVSGIATVFYCNPPFIPSVISSMLWKLQNDFLTPSSSSFPVFVIIVLPRWEWMPEIKNLIDDGEDNAAAFSRSCASISGSFYCMSRILEPSSCYLKNHETGSMRFSPPGDTVLTAMANQAFWIRQ
jgi:hypothetical protein